MKKLFLIFLLLLIPLASAIETFQTNTNVSIEHPVRLNGAPVPTAICNLTVIDPNSDVIIDYQGMTAQVSTHNYTVDSSLLATPGIYNYYITCSDSGLSETDTFQFEITFTGKEKPGTGFIVTFSLLFIIFTVSLLYFFLYAIAKGGKLEFDIRDLSINWGFLFGLLAMYLIFINYWADDKIGGILIWIIGIATTTNGFIPIVLFIVSLIFGSIKNKGVINQYEGRRRMRR